MQYDLLCSFVRESLSSSDEMNGSSSLQLSTHVVSILSALSGSRERCWTHSSSHRNAGVKAASGSSNTSAHALSPHIMSILEIAASSQMSSMCSDKGEKLYGPQPGSDSQQSLCSNSYRSPQQVLAVNSTLTNNYRAFLSEGNEIDIKAKLLRIGGRSLQNITTHQRVDKSSGVGLTLSVATSPCDVVDERFSANDFSSDNDNDDNSGSSGYDNINIGSIKGTNKSVNNNIDSLLDNRDNSYGNFRNDDLVLSPTFMISADDVPFSIASSSLATTISQDNGSDNLSATPVLSDSTLLNDVNAEKLHASWSEIIPAAETAAAATPWSIFSYIYPFESTASVTNTIAAAIDINLSLKTKYSDDLSLHPARISISSFDHESRPPSIVNEGLPSSPSSFDDSGYHDIDDKKVKEQNKEEIIEDEVNPKCIDVSDDIILLPCYNSILNCTFIDGKYTNILMPSGIKCENNSNYDQENVSNDDELIDLKVQLCQFMEHWDTWLGYCSSNVGKNNYDRNNIHSLTIYNIAATQSHVAGSLMRLHKKQTIIENEKYRQLKQRVNGLQAEDAFTNVDDANNNSYFRYSNSDINEKSNTSSSSGSSRSSKAWADLYSSRVSIIPPRIDKKDIQSDNYIYHNVLLLLAISRTAGTSHIISTVMMINHNKRVDRSSRRVGVEIVDSEAANSESPEELCSRLVDALLEVSIFLRLLLMRYFSYFHLFFPLLVFPLLLFFFPFFALSFYSFLLLSLIFLTYFLSLFEYF